MSAGKPLHEHKTDINPLKPLTIHQCMSYFARDNRQKAWRMAGFGARTALELGLDLAEHAHTDQRSLHDPSLHGLPKGSILFCCIYDLDLRSSLMVELPRALPGKLSQDHLHSMV